MCITLPVRVYDIFEDYMDIISASYQRFLKNHPIESQNITEEFFKEEIFAYANEFPQYFTEEELERWEVFNEARNRYYALLENERKDGVQLF